MIIPIILCGGSGSRLWPLSRKMYPKQLLALTGEDDIVRFEDNYGRVNKNLKRKRT